MSCSFSKLDEIYVYIVAMSKGIRSASYYDQQINMELPWVISTKTTHNILFRFIKDMEIFPYP